MKKFEFYSQQTLEDALASWRKEYPDYDFVDLGISVAAIDTDGGFELKFPDFGLNYYYPVSYNEIVDTYEFSSEDIHLMNAREVARLMRRTGYWDSKQCERLCELAGLEQEYASADGESFEAVVEKAAEKLQVEIYR